jgi:hypothetical protein
LWAALRLSPSTSTVPAGLWHRPAPAAAGTLAAAPSSRRLAGSIPSCALESPHRQPVPPQRARRHRRRPGRQVRAGPGGWSILDNITLTVHEGTSVAIVGASGSGKTTLLGLLAGLDLPSRGRIALAGQDLSALDEEARAQLRARGRLRVPELPPAAGADRRRECRAAAGTGRTRRPGAGR